MKKIFKNLAVLAVLSLILIPTATFALNNADIGMNYVSNDIKLGSRDPRTMVAQIINVAMTILGIIAVVIILMGGFKWMTSMGNEEKVGEAKKLMGAGIIGLVIILASWGISLFVINSLMAATQ